MNGRDARCQGGFTLAEVLVSTALLAVVAAASLSLLPGLGKANTTTRDEQRVTLVTKTFFETATAQFATPAGYDLAPPPVAGATGGIVCDPPVESVLKTDASGRATLVRVGLTCTLQGRAYALQHDFARP